MKVKDLIEKLKTANQEAQVVGGTSDHCYCRNVDVYLNGFAFKDKQGQWVEFDEGEETVEKIPIIQIISY